MKRIVFSVGVMESMTRYAEVTGIYHIQFKGSLVRNGVRYYFTNLKKWRLLFPLRFIFFIWKLKPDVIILQGLIFPWQLLMLLVPIKNKPIVIGQHHAEKPFTDFRKYLARRADRLISAYLFSSIDLGKMWVNGGQISDLGKIKIVMGTSSPFRQIPREIARGELLIKGEQNYLWVGDLTSNKDPLTAINAFGEFVSSNPEAKLWMIYKENELESEVREIISVKGISSVIMVGAVEHDQLLYWFNSVDFVVSCSHYEGSGIAICEALSCGCIPILSDIPSFRMLSNNGNHGLHFEVGSVEGLKKCLNQSLHVDKEELKRRGLEWFTNELSFDANARKIMTVINEAKRNR